jgi:hypothetical protein
MFRLKNITKSLNSGIKFNSYNSISSFRGFKGFSSHAAPAHTTENKQSISSRFHDIYITELSKLNEQS